MALGTIQIPFPDSTMPGTHFQESGGRIINSYLEPLGPAAPSTLIYRRAPGLRTFGTTVRNGFRGGIQVGGTLYAAFNNRLVTFTNAGGPAADIGALPGTAIGFFARNARLLPASPTPPDIVFVDPDGNTVTINGTTLGTITRPTDMGAPNSVCSMDGFFVFTVSDGKVWASDNNALTIPALSFGTAENKPDGLIRGVPWAGQLFLFGPSTVEVWANAGTVPFPFQRSVVIPRGLAGPFCVSGFEDNFSRALVWVADDNTVVRLNGYLPEKISPPDLDGLIEREPADANGSKRTLEMSSFMSRGHAFILLSAPTWSWVFDLNNNKWAERNSHLQKRSRITGGVFAFNKWLCGDLLSTNLNEITNTAHTETPGSQLVTGAFGNLNTFQATAAAVVTGGTGYQVGDEIVLTNGVQLIVATLSGATSTIATAVVATDHAGFASGVTPPNPVTQILTNGMGSGGTFNLTWTVIGTLLTPTIKLAVANAHQFYSNTVVVAGIVGTTEANGVWKTNVIDDTHIELIGTVFVNSYVAGSGVVTDTVNPAFRWQLESGAVENFPVGARVGRFDCEFVTGVGMATGAHAVNITGAAAGTGFPNPVPPPATLNRIRLTVTHTQFLKDGDAVTVAGVGGTSEANGTWAIDVIDATHIELSGSAFTHSYTTGGTVIGLTAFDPIETDPIVEISWSDDGGQNYYAPIQRRLGRQAQTRQLVSLIACTGRSSWNARRWRLAIADPVYVGFMAAYQNKSPKVSDIG